MDSGPKYGETFKIPEPIISFDGNDVLLKDLQNPTIKMSKSAENKKGVIYGMFKMFWMW